MKPTLPSPPLMVITNRHMTPDLQATVGGALSGGARWIQLREKDMAPSALLDLAIPLKAQADCHAALLGINSDIVVARSIGAASVHLPANMSHLMADATDILVGISVHDPDEAARAVAAGADYLLLASIFATESKGLHRPPIGLAGLRAIAAAVPVPVIALGGITPASAAACLQAGAAGVAAMGTIMRAAEPVAVTTAFLKAMER